VGEAFVLLPNGGRDRRTVYGRTREDVHGKITHLLNQAQQGIVASNTKLTVEQYLAVWLKDVARRKVRPRTHEVYETVVRRHIVPAIGTKRLNQLGAADVRRLLNAKADEGLAPGTVKKIHVVLGSALQDAFRDDLVTRNVARLVQVRGATPPPVKPLDVAEAQALLEVAQGDRLYALWAVAIGVGLRRGEALGLRWQDVDLEAGTLRVEQALQRTKDGLEFGAPKTERSRRTIPLPAVCVEALRAHRARHAAERLAAGPEWEDTGLVFTSTTGGALQPRSVNRWFGELCERAGLRTVRLHDLRHTCATLLLAQGVAPRVVMETLGHSQIGVTMNTYAHVLPVLQREAADRMDEALGTVVAVKTAVNGSDAEPENGERPSEKGL
jgi:integrase